MIETDSPLIIPIVNWRYIISQFYFLLLFEKIGTEEYLIRYLLFKEYLISYLFFTEAVLIPCSTILKNLIMFTTFGTEEYLICYLLFLEMVLIQRNTILCFIATNIILRWSIMKVASATQPRYMCRPILALPVLFTLCNSNTFSI